ncbi:MAG TPA: glycosyltransferase [Bacteroidia bacterium]|nr:glycosyltransferase [Bacteroidia bacterium]
MIKTRIFRPKIQKSSKKHEKSPQNHQLYPDLDKKKIFIIGPAWPLRGGLATFDELLCRSLNAAGHKTRIISFSLQYPSFLFPGTTQYDTVGKAPADIIIETRINSVNPVNWLSTGNYIHREKPDLLIIRYWLPFMGPSLGTIARRAKKNGYTKVIALVDNAIPHEKRPGDLPFSRYFLKSCDGYLTMSKKVLNDLEQFTNSDLKVFTEHPLYTSFGEPVEKSLARDHLSLEKDGKYLLFFGLIRRYKGLDLLLEAMADDRIRNLGVKLIVAGEYYEDASYYNDIISRLGLKDRVILHTHFIPNDDVRWYFSACDLVTQTYHTATQSGVTKIALQFGKPSLVTDVGGLGEIIHHGKSGYVVPVDAKSIADSIVDFYSNNREAEFVKNTIEEKKKYGWDVMVDNIESLYQEILRR